MYIRKLFYYIKHPGGPELIEEYAGQDATSGFDDFGHSSDAKKMLKDYLIGELQDVSVCKINVCRYVYHICIYIHIVEFQLSDYIIFACNNLVNSIIYYRMIKRSTGRKSTLSLME